MTNVKYVVMIVIVLAGVFLAGKYSSPAKVQIKEVEKIVFQDRIVKDRDRDLESHTKQTKLPDGTIITETDKTLKDKQHSDSQSSMTSSKEFSQVTENRPGWRLGVLYVPDYGHLKGSPVRTTLTLERRLFSEIYLGVNVSTDKQVGISLSIGF